MRKKILITGASGFIGFHLIEEALHKGFSVCAGIRRGSDISHLGDYDIDFCDLDYTNEERLATQLAGAGINYIIHAAGATKAVSQQDYDTVNAEYTHNLASAALKGLGSKLRKFVYISSLAAVGPLNDCTGVITEADLPDPVTAYGRSKLLAEHELQAFPTLPLIVLRPTAVYGPRERDIYTMISAVRCGIEAYIGRQQQQLSFVYVKDLACLAIDSLFSDVSHMTFNISDGNYYDQYELANITKRILNTKTWRLHLPYDLVHAGAFFMETVYGWCGKTPLLNREKLHELTAVNWQCSIEKARTCLDYYPQYDLKRGLWETLLWYRTNKWLYFV